ncbi:uncharacterized protein LOC113276049 isoform X2 [Papaver somniferum]|uniref:uncharacterized protein LOC113276049 isoform X2 n=1 Tax=Papaver somniferum TaxID=3469 RepID=UPI000E70552B|nr:uncharacterized protein LOC113276049 isoform X2 [Papaver somniferum]
MKKASARNPRYQIKSSANSKSRGGKGKTHHELYSSEDDVSDYEKESNQHRRVSGRDTRNKGTSVKKIERSSSYDTKGKGKTHHELYSSEDDVSDYEKELNLPGRVSGRDTRNKGTSVKKIERSYSSEVGKSAKEYQGKPRRVSGRDTRNKGTSVKKIERSYSFEVGKSAKEHQGKLEGGKAKTHQPLWPSKDSSSEDSVSDFEKESQHVLKIQPQRVYNTRSKVQILKKPVRKICPAQERRVGYMDGDRKETGCSLRDALSESLESFYSDLYGSINGDVRYKEVKSDLYGTLRALTFELVNNMLYKMDGVQPLQWEETHLSGRKLSRSCGIDCCDVRGCLFLFHCIVCETDIILVMDVPFTDSPRETQVVFFFLGIF